MKRFLTILMTVLLLCSSTLTTKIVFAEDEEENTDNSFEVQEVFEESEDLEDYSEDEEDSSDEETEEGTSELPYVEEEDIIQSAGSDFTYTVLNGSYIKLTGYTGNDEEIVIPSIIAGYTVQSMEKTFKNNSTIVSVTLPESLETLGSEVFYNCTSLSEIIFQSSLTSIGSYDFYNCKNLESFNFPLSITSRKII